MYTMCREDEFLPTLVNWSLGLLAFYSKLNLLQNCKYNIGDQATYQLRHPTDDVKYTKYGHELGKFDLFLSLLILLMRWWLRRISFTNAPVTIVTQRRIAAVHSTTTTTTTTTG